MKETMSTKIVAAALVVEAILVTLWASGLVVLGAIVAPTVFRIVPAPHSADAMTVVFRRFDQVAIYGGCLALFMESLAAWRRKKTTPFDLGRAVALGFAWALALLTGVWLSPGIEALHREGALRGLGESGLRLERLHSLAEAVAKGELLLLVTVLVMLVVRATRPFVREDVR